MKVKQPGAFCSLISSTLAEEQLSLWLYNKHTVTAQHTVNYHSTVFWFLLFYIQTKYRDTQKEEMTNKKGNLVFMQSIKCPRFLDLYNWPSTQQFFRGQTAAQPLMNSSIFFPVRSCKDFFFFNLYDTKPGCFFFTLVFDHFIASRKKLQNGKTQAETFCKVEEINLDPICISWHIHILCTNKDSEAHYTQVSGLFPLNL